MKIEWVNHASFVADYGGVRLISDPWLEGTAFDDGWKLLSPTKFPYERFDTITHLWFSHEHPDHFSPLSLRNIPDEARARITVLFQKTNDRKVVKFCERLGFARIVELQRRRWYPLSERFQVLSEPFPYGDSSLLIKTDRHRVANLNDCTIETYRHARELASLLEGRVDLVLSQFSYANWVGNPEDKETRRRGAEEKLEAIRNHCLWLAPEFTIPFASFVWFCHQENAYTNDLMNRIDDVAAFISEQTTSKPIVLYPGTEWTLGEPHDNQRSVELYLSDYADIETSDLLSAPTVPRQELVEAASSFVVTLVGRQGSAARAARARFHRLQLSRLWITDYDAAFEFSVERGLVPTGAPRDECDIAASSESFNNTFKNLYGGDTLQINGRFVVPPRGHYMRFRRYGMLASKLNIHGSYRNFLKWRLLEVLRHPVHTLGRVADRVLRRGRPAGGLTVAPKRAS